MFWDWVLLINYVFRNQKYYFLKIWKFWYQYWLTISDLFNGKRKFSLRKTLVFGQNSSFLLEIESLLPNFAKIIWRYFGRFFEKKNILVRNWENVNFHYEKHSFSIKIAHLFPKLSHFYDISPNYMTVFWAIFLEKWYFGQRLSHSYL